MANFKPGANPFDVPNTLFPQKDKPAETVQTGEPMRLPIEKLKPFSKHPFKAYDDEKLKGLSESIREHGVITPIFVRPIEDEKYEYEIISGHNRVQASRLAGLDEIPSTVKELDDEVATILMVDSNLEQRENILPSEKAFAYKYKLEAIKKQGSRKGITSTQVALKLQSNDVVGKEANESGDTVRRYIRLTHLNNQLLEKVDERKLAFIPAVELSYLSKKEQGLLVDVLTREENFGVPMKQASILKNMSQTKSLTFEQIDQIMTAKTSNTVSSFKVPYKKVQDFFPKTVTPREFEETIIEALAYYFEHQQDLDLDR